MNSSAHGRDGLGHDGRDRVGGGVDVDIGGAQGALGLGQGGELERGLGDQGQGAFRADDEPRQIIADHALGGHDAGVEDFASAAHGAQTQGILARACRI